MGPLGRPPGADVPLAYLRAVVGRTRGVERGLVRHASAQAGRQADRGRQQTLGAAIRVVAVPREQRRRGGRGRVVSVV